jgi:predicted metal-dependent peptidase
VARQRSKQKSSPDPHYQSFVDGMRIAEGHPILRHIGDAIRFSWREDTFRCWAQVHPDGLIVANRHIRGTPGEWAWVVAHLALHLGFGHLSADRPVDPASRAAACLVVTRFQQQLRLGTPPSPIPPALPGSDENQLAELWRLTGVPPEWQTEPDHFPGPFAFRDGELSWTDRLAVGLASAASEAVAEAGAVRVRQVGEIDPDDPWEQARRWFVGAFPLLGALAAGFTIVADAQLARSWQISVAAVAALRAEIYVNPLVNLPAEERRFVLAHEMLHAALRHGERVGPRDPYLWNIAADFVVNGWLVELGVGQVPQGALYDPRLKGRGVEDVYDEITKNLRRFRKLATMRGRGLEDMIGDGRGDSEKMRAGDLDDFYRRALVGGAAHHHQLGRGLLPSGLAEEIRVLEHPPPPWDVQLAQWFDRFFTPLERSRSYARASRRQASTPEIPRPGWVRPVVTVRDRTFGVVLDTSGSMGSGLLGKALGAIASYALARDVPAARVVFCDAAAYDAGYLPVEEIAGRVRVRGRGGTILQPGINLLESADDFPPDGPILIITDGRCDVVRVRREHAYLVPRGSRLPFMPRGEVFHLS